jgi:4-hydroxybenzoate polyprenyltransferase
MTQRQMGSVPLSRITTPPDTGKTPAMPTGPSPSPSAAQVVRGLVREMRPKQWTKNLLLFFGLIFALKMTDARLLGLAAAGFLVFCAASSAIYVVNDLADLDRDRHHPVKRTRPIAAGIVTPTQAIALATVLLVGSILGAFALQPIFGAVTLGFLALNVAYSFWLKHVVLIDVFSIAAGFVIRAVAGAIVVGVPISPWLYVCTVLAALFVAMAKRRHELVLLSTSAGRHRRILEEYSPELLDQMITVVTAATVMAYSLYTFSADNLPKNHAMMLTVPFVLYGIFRYLYLMYMKNGGGSPEDVLLKDVPFLANAVLWMATAVAILYVFRT